jgi:hypothetical protein
MRGTVFDGNAFDLNVAPDVVSGVNTELCDDVVGTGQSGLVASTIAKSVMNPFVFGNTYRIVIYLTPVTPLLTISDKTMDVTVAAGVRMPLQCNNSNSKVHCNDPQGNATHPIHCLDAGKDNLSTFLLQVIFIDCKHPNHMLRMAIGTFSPVVKRSNDLWILNAPIMHRLCRSMLMMYRPIDRGRHLQRPFHC